MCIVCHMTFAIVNAGYSEPKASDRSGGISASFIVAWESAMLCVPPVVEAVMISTASTQGSSFSSQARVVEEKR